MNKPSVLVLDFFYNNLEIIKEVYKKWDYEKCLKLSNVLIDELKNYSDVHIIWNKVMIYKQQSLLEIFFEESIKK